MLYSPLRCHEHCQGQGYLFFILYSNTENLQNSAGKQCLCGNSTLSDADKVDESSCDVTCPGDQSAKCGGKNRLMSLYRVKAKIPGENRFCSCIYFGCRDDIGCITEPDSVCITDVNIGYNGGNAIETNRNILDVEACRSYCNSINAPMFTLHTGNNGRCVCKNPTDSFQKKNFQGSTSGNTFCFRELFRELYLDDVTKLLDFFTLSQ